MVEKPVAVGITLLDYDHVQVLGDTIEKIAWQKAGIMKSGSVAFANPTQPEGALQVLRERSEEIGSTLHFVPPLDKYDWRKFPPHHIGLFQQVHAYNASLALQLARYFVTRKRPNQDGFALNWKEALGLRLCYWPGRSQVIRKGYRTYFLDGAHTDQSMMACRQWFDHVHDADAYKVLVFNSTGDRNPEVLLKPLVDFKFNLAIFCTNETKHENLQNDNTNLNFSFPYALRKCEANQATWNKMQTELDNNDKDHSLIPSRAVSHIEDALHLIDKLKPEAPYQKAVHVYVTGSLHLVGGVLSFIHPNCYEKMSDEMEVEVTLREEYIKLDD